jgi:gluconolactonase
MTREMTSAFGAAGLFLLSFGAGCQSAPVSPAAPATQASSVHDYPSVNGGSIERTDAALDALVPQGAKIELLASGFTWAEGPVWTSDGGGALLFSDVPNNVIHRWNEREGLTEFVKPSGYTGQEPRKGNIGANGLTFDAAGHLLMCQHGDRRVAMLEADRSFRTVADTFEGKRFNSPNDLVVRSNGDVYFTDPPYGFEGAPAWVKKELPFSGVYRRTPAGAVTLLTKELSFPNGIAFSPDEKVLYVSNSDPERAIWMAYDVTPEGGIGNVRVFYDATAMVKAGKKGLPDGLKVDEHGNLFAGGPGGVLVFTPDAKLLGTIVTGEPTANVGFGPAPAGESGSYLYMTAHDKLCRIRVSTTPAWRAK